MSDGNNMATPAATMPLGTYTDEPPFDKTCEYDSVVGMLMYLSSNSRTDIQFSVQQCSRITHDPSKSHAEAVKRICHYLVRTQGQGLNFDLNSDMKLDCYVDGYL